MKKKKPRHPRLYIEEININSSSKLFKYLSNSFDNSGRVLKEEVEKIDENDGSIIKKNLLEYRKLENFIKIQKNVLKKHQKAGNYDASNILKSSVMLMEDFKKEFDSWFKINKIKL